MPLIPNYVPGVGSFAADGFQFQAHIDGDGYKHDANEIVVSPLITINGSNPTNVQDALAALSAALPPQATPNATIGDSISNLGLITLGGDLSGVNSTALIPRVSGVQGFPFARITPSTNQVLAWNGTSYGPSNLTFTGDITGGINASKVASISGTSPVAINSTLAIQTGVAINILSGGILEAKSGSTITLDSGSYLNASGDVAFLSGGLLDLQSGSSINMNGVVNTPITFASSLSAANITQTGTSGHNLEIAAQNGVGLGGALVLASGTGSTAGDIYFNTGGYQALVISPTVATLNTNFDLTGVMVDTLTFTNSLLSPNIAQGSPTSDIPPSAFTIQAAAAYSAATSHQTGAALNLNGGTPVGGGLYGAVLMNCGSNTVKLGTLDLQLTGSQGLRCPGFLPWSGAGASQSQDHYVLHFVASTTTGTTSSLIYTTNVPNGTIFFARFDWIKKETSTIADSGGGTQYFLCTAASGSISVVSANTGSNLSVAMTFGTGIVADINLSTSGNTLNIYVVGNGSHNYDWQVVIHAQFN